MTHRNEPLNKRSRKYINDVGTHSKVRNILLDKTESFQQPVFFFIYFLPRD